MHFSFQGRFYEQVKGAAMGSPVSPIVANLYMEYFEQKALSTPPPPRFWCRYVDDTLVIQKEIHKQDFLQHINSVDPASQFTVENNKEEPLRTHIKCSFSVLPRPDEVHSSGWKLVYKCNQSSVPEKNTWLLQERTEWETYIKMSSIGLAVVTQRNRVIQIVSNYYQLEKNSCKVPSAK